MNPSAPADPPPKSRPAQNLYQRLQALIPQRCCLCDARIGGGLGLCDACHKELPFISAHCPRCARRLVDRSASSCGDCLKDPPPWQHCLATVHYEIPADYLIKRFKYAGDTACGRTVAALMTTHAWPQRDLLSGALFVPVPLHRSRLLERGFNQSEMLARALSHAFDGRLCLDLLERHRATCPQAGLTTKARRSNTKNAFRANRRPGERHIVLVDDVLTTGSTARECCRVLQRAGAETLTLCCFARASNPRQFAT